MWVEVPRMMDYQKQSQLLRMLDHDGHSNHSTATALEVADVSSTVHGRLHHLTPALHCYDHTFETKSPAALKKPDSASDPTPLPQPLLSGPSRATISSSSFNDTPIDLSQLSTRRNDPINSKRLDSDCRSASESCLALGPGKRLQREQHSVGSSDQNQRPLQCHNASSSKASSDRSQRLLQQQRSMSDVNLSEYRTSWRQSSASSAGQEATIQCVPSEPSIELQLLGGMDPLKLRSPSDSRLTAISDLQRLIAGRGGNTTDRTHNNDDNRFESLLRRTASESVIPSNRSADASTVAIDVLSRQQDLVQQHFQQLAQLQKQHLSYGSSAGGSADASTLSSPNLLANQWLYLQLFGYSHMLRSIQAQEILKQVNNLSHSPVESGSNSGQVSAGPSSPMPSPSGSDEYCDVTGAGTTMGSANNGKRRSPRALTGKHVRLGTGASPTTLHTLRLKIEERQKLKLCASSAAWGSSSAASSQWSANTHLGVKKSAKVKSRTK